MKYLWFGLHLISLLIISLSILNFSTLHFPNQYLENNSQRRNTSNNAIRSTLDFYEISKTNSPILTRANSFSKSDTISIFPPSSIQLRKAGISKQISFKINDEDVNIIRIENQQNVLIKNLNITNTKYIIQNSAYITVLNNFFGNLADESFQPSFLQIINSDNIVIQNNSFGGIKAQNSTFSGISILKSSNIDISDNSFLGMHSESVPDDDFNISSAIRIKKSNSININSNTISQLSSSSISGILITESLNINLNDNQISKIKASMHLSFSEAFGMFISESEKVEITNNSIDDLNTTTFMENSNVFGIFVQDSSETDSNQNNISNIQSNSNIPSAYGIEYVNTTYGLIHQNVIQNITSVAENPINSFSTGIYLAFSSNTTMSENLIDNIISIGIASYGIFLDFSSSLLVEQNSIENIIGEAPLSSIAIAMTLRTVKYSVIQENTIRFVEAISTNNGISGSSISARSIGILLDLSKENEILNNSIDQVFSKANSNIAADTQGITLSSSQDVLLVGNKINDIATPTSHNSLVTGMLISNSHNLIMMDNQITKLNSSFFAIGVFMISSNFANYENNTVSNIFGRAESQGITFNIFTGLVFRSNRITNITSLGSISLIIITVITQSIFDNNFLKSEFRNNSIGFKIDGSNNLNILTNIVNDLDSWISIKNSSTITCEGNIVDGVISNEDCPNTKLGGIQSNRNLMLLNSAIIVILVLLIAYNGKIRHYFKKKYIKN